MRFKRGTVFKYLSGKYSLNDKRIVDEYFKDNIHSKDLGNALNDHWNELLEKKSQINKNLNPLLDKLNHQIHLQSAQKKSKLRVMWEVYSKVAAILILPILFASVYYFQNIRANSISTWVEVHSPYGTRTQFTLPDGSHGWLNGGSILKYPGQFGAERMVSLNGEAFFEVTKNPVSPFIVDAKGLKVKVLGTSFNVVSYDNDSITEVVVATGEVEVQGECFDFNQKLQPSQRLVMSRLSNSLKRSTVDVENYTSWKTGKLIFLNDNLNQVIRKVSRFYNVDFEIGSDVNTKQLFRAILEEEGLHEILRYIKLTMPLDFVIHEREQNQNGTISKRKVTITNAIRN